MTVKTEGFEDLEKQIAQIANMYQADKTVRATLAKAVRRALEPVAERARAAAPYDEFFNTSGIHLRDTIRTDARIPTAKDHRSGYVHPNDIVIGVVSAKKSAVSLSHEFGNARTSAKFFLRNSFESDLQGIVDTIKSELEEIVPRYARNLRKQGKIT